MTVYCNCLLCRQSRPPAELKEIRLPVPPTVRAHVPARGEYFVRDGKIIPVLESELTDPGAEEWAWNLWTRPQEDDDG